MKTVLIVCLLAISLTVKATEDAQVLDFNRCRSMSKVDRSQCLIQLSNSMLENSLTIVDAKTGEAVQGNVRIGILDDDSSKEIISGVVTGNKISLNGISGAVRILISANGYAQARVKINLNSSGKQYFVPIKLSTLGGASGLGLLTSADEPNVTVSDLTN